MKSYSRNQQLVTLLCDIQSSCAYRIAKLADQADRNGYLSAEDVRITMLVSELARWSTAQAGLVLKHPAKETLQ